MNRVIFLASLSLFACSNPSPSPGTGLPDAKTGLGDGTVNDADASTSTVSDVSDTNDDDSPFSCTDGETACFNDTVSKICVNGGWVVKQQCVGSQVCQNGDCVTPVSCPAGATVGCDGFGAELHCNATGDATFDVACAAGQICVSDATTSACKVTACVPYIPECTPGSTTSFQTCLPDGSGYGDVTQCKPGSVCFAGKCTSLCEQGVKFGGNIGCEYWSVDLDNDAGINPASLGGPTPEMIPHSVVISNPGQFDATITFTIQATCADGSVCSPTVTTCNNKKSTVCETPGPSVNLVFSDSVVPAGQTKEFKMPVMNASGSGVMRKAIHVTSDQPIVAYQANPYNADGATSNDGSLLLPQNALGKTYFAIVPAQSGGIMLGSSRTASAFVTIVATVPGTTTVNLTPTRDCQVNYKLGVPGDGTKPASLAAGTTYSFQILQFDVLNIEELGKSDMVPPGTGPQALPNMTGTKVVADQPVAVFSGHEVAELEDDMRFQGSGGSSDSTWNTCCTEHMEEQLIPEEFWGTVANCVKTKPRGDEVDEYVVVAGEDGVKLTTIPANVGSNIGKELNGVVLNTGERARIQTDQSFMIQATGKIQVAQLLMSAGQTGSQSNGSTPTLGDASMALIPPQSQYRPDYTIQTPAGFTANYVTITRPVGLALQVDGSPLNAGFQSFGDGTWEYAYVEFQPGTHTIENAGSGPGTPFGLMVYGYGDVTAYSFPGGMVLK